MQRRCLEVCGRGRSCNLGGGLRSRWWHRAGRLGGMVGPLAGWLPGRTHGLISLSQGSSGSVARRFWYPLVKYDVKGPVIAEHVSERQVAGRALIGQPRPHHNPEQQAGGVSTSVPGCRTGIHSRTGDLSWKNWCPWNRFFGQLGHPCHTVYSSIGGRESHWTLVILRPGLHWADPWQIRGRSYSLPYQACNSGQGPNAN